MQAEGIRAEELPRWVPGQVVLASDGFDWSGVKLRSYRYTPLDVEVPALRDFMIVAYRKGPTTMERRCDGRWRHEDLIPGDVSLLTRAQPSHWHWDCGIEVIHVYLTARLMQQVSEEVFERPVAEVDFEDVLKTHDAVLFNGALAIAHETAVGALGGNLYVEAVARQLCVHALRHYASVRFRDVTSHSGLSRTQERKLIEFIEAHLAHVVTIERMAQALGVTAHWLLRHFKQRFGVAPHAYVVARRLERARELLSTTALGVQDIANLSGFSDQPHLTRLFKRAYGLTPAAWRRSNSA